MDGPVAVVRNVDGPVAVSPSGFAREKVDGPVAVVLEPKWLQDCLTFRHVVVAAVVGLQRHIIMRCNPKQLHARL